VISYAQNAEDVVLARLFTANTGRYVDAGAAYPMDNSVTKHFYDLGWSGINIEPVPKLADELRRERPRDTTLAVALGDHHGTTTLYVVADRVAWTTTDPTLAQAYHDFHQLQVNEIQVQLLTLANILDSHPGPVDFLKIDVEGSEHVVLTGMAFDRHRPRVVVVEATEPGFPTPVYDDWEPLLLAAGYRCALFDGLNRFYGQADDDEALEKLGTPANVFDDFEPWSTVVCRSELEEVRRQNAAQVEQIRQLTNQVRLEQDRQRREIRHVRSLYEQIEELKNG
jgi:FkbM family methyltransferase